MLQISQTEKPMCSATIDQMRLRRAINLPLAFQNFSFSGSQSEIHVVFNSLVEDFVICRLCCCVTRSVRSPFFFAANKKAARPEARLCAFPRTAALLSARHWTRSAGGTPRHP